MGGSWRPRSLWIRKRVAQYWELRQLEPLVNESRKLGKARYHMPRIDCALTVAQPAAQGRQLPLVSILIPACNAKESIAHTLRSAFAQTWKRKEIIVVNDGSTDQTLAIARQFEGAGVSVGTQKNQGAAFARNKAFALSQGDYIQWLDADDLLAPDEIATQMQTLEQGPSNRVVLSSAWAVHVPAPSGEVYSDSAVVRPVSDRVAAAQDGREPLYADRHLAGQPRVDRSCGAMGYEAVER